MNDRIRNPQAAPAEVNDLSDLRASLPQKSPTIDLNSATDLSSASIQSIPVARLSARPERRALAHLTPTPTFAALRGHATRDTVKGKTTPPKPNGIFKNPYYRYQGGPIGRLVALIANIIKALEHALFRKFRAPLPTPAPPAPKQLERKEEQRLTTKKNIPTPKTIKRD